jgi:hypothetical protein
MPVVTPVRVVYVPKKAYTAASQLWPATCYFTGALLT